MAIRIVSVRRSLAALAVAASCFSSGAKAASCAYPIPANLPAGFYGLALFAGDPYESYVSSPAPSFYVASGSTTSITVSWTQAVSDAAWVGLYPAGAPIDGWASYRYVRDCVPLVIGPNDVLMVNDSTTGLPVRMKTTFGGQQVTLEYVWGNTDGSTLPVLVSARLWKGGWRDTPSDPADGVSCPRHILNIPANQVDGAALAGQLQC